MNFLAYRFKPGEDLYDALESSVQTAALDAAAIVTVVGSLTCASLRLASKESGSLFQGPFEIVSCVGTLSKHGSHIHLSVSDKDGEMLGGHLMPGSLIYTTAEVVIVDLSAGWCFERKQCQESGYLELDPVRLD